MAYTTHNSRVATGTWGPIETFGRTISEWVRRYLRYREFVRAEAELNALSDRNLADVGLTRTQIHDRVWAGY